MWTVGFKYNWKIQLPDRIEQIQAKCARMRVTKCQNVTSVTHC